MIGGSSVAAIVLAAGLSSRMGRPKMVLPWAGKTVIETVISTISGLQLAPIIVVTGGSRQEVEQRLAGFSVQCVFNPLFENGEMLNSIQTGMKALAQDLEAVLVALGDQPQMEKSTLAALLEQASLTSEPMILPSYQMRRGHPWLIRRSLWPAILALHPPETMRDFFCTYASQIAYVRVETSSVLMDLDTPQDYENQRPDCAH